MYEVKSRLTVFGNDGCGLHLLRQHVNPLIIEGFKDDPTLAILTCEEDTEYNLINIAAGLFGIKGWRYRGTIYKNTDGFECRRYQLSIRDVEDIKTMESNYRLFGWETPGFLDISKFKYEGVTTDNYSEYFYGLQSNMRCRRKALLIWLSYWCEHSVNLGMLPEIHVNHCIV